MLKKSIWPDLSKLGFIVAKMLSFFGEFFGGVIMVILSIVHVLNLRAIMHNIAI